MQSFILNRYYVVKQKIDEQENYYSHWERLYPTSKVYGIVWNEYLAYCYFFTTNKAAKKMRDRIKEYDPKIAIEVFKVTKGDINNALDQLKRLKLPDPIDHTSEIMLVPV